MDVKIAQVRILKMRIATKIFLDRTGLAKADSVWPAFPDPHHRLPSFFES